MSWRAHLVIVLALAGLTFGGAALQASAADEGGPASGLRLVCPLH